MSGRSFEKENEFTALGSKREVSDVRYIPKPESDGSETINAPQTHMTPSIKKTEPISLVAVIRNFLEVEFASPIKFFINQNTYNDITIGMRPKEINGVRHISFSQFR